MNLQQMLVKLYMITRCSQELFSLHPFILKTKHDTVSLLHSVVEDPSTRRRRRRVLRPRYPPGLGGLMKSDPSFIKIQGWDLVIKKSREKKKTRGERTSPR